MTIDAGALLIAALVLLVLFILWASKSIARAIVFAVVMAIVFPVLLVVGFAMLAATAPDSPPQRIERTKR
jgi:hypothetical protein